MPYNDIINWPQSIDTFPSLSDNTTPNVSDDQIVYAEHWNKIRNFIQKAQTFWTNTAVVTGDSSLKALHFPSDPSTMGFIIPLPNVAKIVAPWAYDPQSTGTNIPGNVLPFEFVLTTDTVYVIPWSNGSFHMAQQTSSTILRNYLKGFSFLGYPRFQCSLYKNDMVQGSANLDPGIFAHYCNQDLQLNSWGMTGDDVLIVRGSVVDMSGDSPVNGMERWDMYPDWSIVCVFQGVRVA